MAEFSRKSGRRILESIDTRKASKQEVFAFYQRQRKQLKSKGGNVGAALKLKDIKKSDIVKELQALEEIQRNVRAAQKAEKVKEFTAKYEKTKAEMQGKSAFAGVERYKQFQKSLKSAASRGDIDLKTFIGGAFKDIQKKKPKERPTKQAEKRQPEQRAAAAATSERKQLRSSSKSFRGRLAHDLVSKWVDDMLLDPESFDDSDTIWGAMELVDENPTDFQFFKDYYSGEEKEGTQSYYEEFQAFIDIKPEFEAAMAAEGIELPPYPSADYWQMLQDWRRSRSSSL